MEKALLFLMQLQEKQIGTASSKGLDFSEMMDYATKVGGPTLRKMTFQERGLMLKALALHLHSIKNKFYALSAEQVLLGLILGLILKEELEIFLPMHH